MLRNLFADAAICSAGLLQICRFHHRNYYYNCKTVIPNNCDIQLANLVFGIKLWQTNSSAQNQNKHSIKTCFSRLFIFKIGLRKMLKQIHACFNQKYFSLVSYNIWKKYEVMFYPLFIMFSKRNRVFSSRYNNDTLRDKALLRSTLKN